MSIFPRRAITGACLLLSTAAATATPVVLDTEQKAAAGLATALFKAETPRQVNGAIDTVREYADDTLKRVNAATTPAALLATPGGIAVDCGVSGSFTARMADELPRVLRVRYQNCATLVFGDVRTLNGPAVITLPEDNFRPSNVLSIRLGNDSGEFFEQVRFESPDQNDDVTLAFNIRLNGDISMLRLAGCCEWLGSSTFDMNGYFETRQLTEFPPGSSPVLINAKLIADRISVVRSTNNANGIDADDTLLARGSLTFEQIQPPPYGAFTDAYGFKEYRVRRSTDFNTFVDTLSIDGKLDVTWNQFVGAGCMNGLYTFRTRAPIVVDLNTQAFSSGDLVVNGDVVAKFYSAANTPPSLPPPVNGMLLNMRVRDVGTFNYDAPNWFAALPPVGHCPQ